MSTISKLRGSGNRKSSAGAVKLVAQITFDPIVASAATGYILPKGAVILAVTSFGGAIGGVTPTVDIGVDGTPDNIAGELDADTAGTAGVVGALGFAPLAANTEVWAGVGASAATGGETTIAIEYYIEDERNGANG